MAWDRAHPHRLRRLSGVQPERPAAIAEEGVLFRSHLNGDPHLFTPESTMDVQLALGSDIMMVLDECPTYPVSHESAAAEAMRRTVRWAQSRLCALPSSER